MRGTELAGLNLGQYFFPQKLQWGTNSGLLELLPIDHSS